MNAAAASFQFTGRMHDFHHSVRSAPTFHSSYFEANGWRHSRSGGAASSRLIHAHPPHVSQRTALRARSSASRFASSKALGRSTKVLVPSSPQHQP